MGQCKTPRPHDVKGKLKNQRANVDKKNVFFVGAIIKNLI